jgi:hypothetical protein
MSIFFAFLKVTDCTAAPLKSKTAGKPDRLDVWCPGAASGAAAVACFSRNRLIIGLLHWPSKHRVMAAALARTDPGQQNGQVALAVPGVTRVVTSVHQNW